MYSTGSWIRTWFKPIWKRALHLKGMCDIQQNSCVFIIIGISTKYWEKKKSRPPLDTVALSAAGASLTIFFTWLGKIPPWGTGRFHCTVPHFIMPTYRSFNHASHLEDPRAASRSSKPSQQLPNMKILPPRLHIKPAPQNSACKLSTVAKKSSHQEGCDCWCMPDEQDAQDGIAMQLQPFVSLWKILYLTHKMWVLLQGFWGGFVL